ncbi:PREDICTED: uncharacterized protein LOC108561141 [Nicrophorus vespilloides]|uniref:Uncharacterized protein LOC108561141 n=1 Tax=Nicrophorus vespilloides TaxID=110193 RepID=A0ABM1MIP1_NICVS|nr:PREDICTED: uncharacterized protein LOC108561141 [Nicrophorus vespilloides]XP_017774442.1 PREDICTED: uncharacterized protein LOC108561141 [Nicrophorus vespilloides]
MALLNYSFPYHAAAAAPPPPQPYVPPSAYHYPRPHTPFTAEDADMPPPATPHYTQVRGGGGSKAQVHAVIDYDYYEDGGGGGHQVVHPGVGGHPQHQTGGGGLHHQPAVTPIQGPIYLKNGTVPVVPLYSYPQINNGSFVQIPILWTALSVALGLEIRGEFIRGVPCIKRYQQLFCPTAGNTYPLERIETFIDDNKALMKRMYGEFIMGPDYDTEPTRKPKRAPPPGVPDLHAPPGPESMFAKVRVTRQSFRNNQSSETGRVDACQSKVEIVTPYWASNSAGKIRAIVNTQHFEQAIHQEVCAKKETGRCSGECGCEQKYKWHRLLAYDPDNDCKGIFMDWFLFPSCCVCRCNPT